mmetsp:Transcript_28644/g.61428  ORF Transcript_28644/g.61428 Transcript_28644/m.61428 type:complete len:388 (+) Transcript_28644:141-1304(+)
MPVDPSMASSEYKRQHSRWLQWGGCALVALVLQIVATATTTTAATTTPGAERRIPFATRSALAFDATSRSFPRGGESLFGATAEGDDHDDGDEEEELEEQSDIRQHPEYEKLQSYRMKQQVLLQLRATFLSESLAKRGLPVPSLQDVSTPDGRVPPQRVDWDCALSTEEDPKHCLISYEPEPGSKLVVPMELASTDKWITLAALNRLRRDDPSKVEPMWSDKYAVLSSWFGPNSRYSLLQHVGPKGVVLSTLLDGNRLPAVVGALLVLLIIQLLPVIEMAANRLLVSGFLWTKWASWHRYVHIGLPFKLLIVQTIISYASKAFAALVSVIKDRLLDLEGRILEETIPLTVGEGAEDDDDDAFEEIDTDESNDDGGDDSSDYDEDEDE